MKTKKYKTTLLSILCSLFSILCFSQNYEWDWAKSGGGGGMLGAEIQGTLSSFNAEMIWDIAIDEDNNYYFLANLSTIDTHVDGNLVPNYYFSSPPHLPYANRDIILFSFACDGTYLWSKVIGGADEDYAYKMVLDNNGGIYISAIVPSIVLSSGAPLTCFDDDDCLPAYDDNNQSMEQEGRRMGFILKYDAANGAFIWRKDLQGNVNASNRRVSLSHLQIDSNNILHTVVGFRNGTHLDGAITVELDENADHNQAEYYLLKLDSATGNLIAPPLQIPLSGWLTDFYTSFRYDEALNRYYIAGTQSPSIQVSFNGVDFGGQQTSGLYYSFVISFNPNDLDDWWYKEITVTNTLYDDSRIHGMEIDSNSDIYINGSYFIINTDSASFGNHTFSSVPYHGNRAFILKMNSQGEVQWSKIPDNQGTVGGGQTLPSSYDVAINGDEVALAGVVGITQWGDFSVNRPNGHGLDPALIRFDKQTGEVIGLHDIMGYQGGDYYLTAVTADNDGNYVVGGAMRSILFIDNPNGIPTLYNTGSGAYTDFFFARLANSACGSASNEVFEQQTLRLYPNPTSGLVYIEATHELQSYEVYNLLGQRLLSGTSEVINLQDLSKGTYIVKVRTQSGEVMTSKVIKH